MWIIFGGLAIAFTIANFAMYTYKRDFLPAMVLALAFTALTCVELYRQATLWVRAEDWGALSDVLPTMEVWLWGLTIVSIILNCSTLYLKKKSNKHEF